MYITTPYPFLFLILHQTVVVIKMIILSCLSLDCKSYTHKVVLVIKIIGPLVVVIRVVEKVALLEDF